MPAITNITRDRLHAGGETTFIVQKVEFGLTAYRIMENNGHLDYEVDVANAPKQGWRGMFELCESPNNHIRPSIWKLLRSPAIMMRPEFKQIFSSDEGRYNTPFNHVVIGATKVSLLPFPSFSGTVYLWRLPDGHTVPVAYSVYY